MQTAPPNTIHMSVDTINWLMENLNQHINRIKQGKCTHCLAKVLAQTAHPDLCDQPVTCHACMGRGHYQRVCPNNQAPKGQQQRPFKKQPPKKQRPPQAVPQPALTQPGGARPAVSAPAQQVAQMTEGNIVNFIVMKMYLRMVLHQVN